MTIYDKIHAQLIKGLSGFTIPQRIERIGIAGTDLCNIVITREHFTNSYLRAITDVLKPFQVDYRIGVDPIDHNNVQLIIL